MSDPGQIDRAARAIQIVVEVDEERNVKVFSNYKPADIEVVRCDELEQEKFIEKARAVGKKTPIEVFAE